MEQVLGQDPIDISSKSFKSKETKETKETTVKILEEQKEEFID